MRWLTSVTLLSLDMHMVPFVTPTSDGENMQWELEKCRDCHSLFLARLFVISYVGNALQDSLIAFCMPHHPVLTANHTCMNVYMTADQLQQRFPLLALFILLHFVYSDSCFHHLWSSFSSFCYISFKRVCGWRLGKFK